MTMWVKLDDVMKLARVYLVGRSPAVEVFMARLTELPNGDAKTSSSNRTVTKKVQTSKSSHSR